MEDVLNEIKGLAKSGYKEVVLTGIHLSSYGVDTGETLLSLIEHVHEIEGIERIPVSYTHLAASHRSEIDRFILIKRMIS